MKHRFATEWLNRTAKHRGWVTREWKDVLFDIKEGRITTLKQVTDVYKVSKVNQESDQNDMQLVSFPLILQLRKNGNRGLQ